MHISLNSFTSHAVFLFKENLLPALSVQQKKICIVASIAFGLLTTFYLVNRYYFQKLQNSQINQIDPHEEVAEDKVDEVKPIVKLDFVIKENGFWMLRNKSNNVLTTGRPYYLEINNRIFEPKDLPLKKTIDKINIFMMNSNSLKSQVKLPEKLMRNLIKFIVNGPPNPAFDCHAFIASIFDKRHSPNGDAISFQNWNFENFEQKKLTPGTAVYLSKEDKGKHSALYLGNEQYISVFGPSGPLIVANLQEMKKLFDAEDSYILEPK